MMVKSGLEYFEIPRAPSVQKKICPERLNWPERLAGISEGAREISKTILDHFSPSFLSQKLLFQHLICH
jgi:hypothetical protein